MNRREGLILATDINSYFEGEVRVALQKQGVEISPFASQYLAKMLTRFSDARAYLQKNQSPGEDPRQSYPTLSLLWLEGLSKNMSEQLHQFQLLGDLALFTSGFFGERVSRSLVDMDYYIAMGGRAYERAGHIKDSIQAERAVNIYFELAGSFENLVDVLAEISDKSLLHTDKDILKLYQKWLTTGSERVRRMLGEQGIIPAVGVVKNEFDPGPSTGSGSTDGQN